MTNGQRMNQLVAPTSFMISTSRLRAKIESRMVLEMRSTATMPSSTMKPEQEVAGLRREAEQLVGDLLAVADLVDDGVAVEARGHGVHRLRIHERDLERGRQRVAGETFEDLRDCP